MGIRLCKAIRELNIGMQTAIDLLSHYPSLGIVQANLKHSLSDKQYDVLRKAFAHNPDREHKEKAMQEDVSLDTFFKTEIDRSNNMDSSSKNTSNKSTKPTKKGLMKLGFVNNLIPKDGKLSCYEELSKLAGKEITVSQIEEYVESPDFSKEYIDRFGNVVNQGTALIFRFKLPYPDNQGCVIWGFYSRNSIEKGFAGVVWNKHPWLPSRIDIYKYGHISKESLEKFSELCGENVSIKDLKPLKNWIRSDIEFFNGAGYKEKDGQPVDKSTAKFIRFKTGIEKDGKTIYGWFTRKGNGFEGITWGTDVQFNEAQELRGTIGRLKFNSVSEANKFFKKLAKEAMEEPWTFEGKEDKKQILPILRSYIGNELERLFYEQDECKEENRIIYNEARNKALFNTNLVDKYGHDILLYGNIEMKVGVEYLANVDIITGGKQQLEKLGFDTNAQPDVPEFFKRVEELLFHPDWDFDLENNRDKCNHIIDDNRKRFPTEYQKKTSQKLMNDLSSAVDFARRIAKRNYKFIIPMYYPRFKRIQLLMPIYLDGEYKDTPDFALVLTPYTDKDDPQKGYYVPETILGLDEVYQDARLIAKPEESWLNPRMIR